MTAEIAILNRNAVALAADSAVTLQTEAQAPKIYNTNKLFTLSKYEPVAVMIYGNAEFMDVPWETAVKAYRAHLGQKSFGEIKDYGNDFLKFIGRNLSFFPPERQETHAYNLVASWLHMLKHRLLTEVGPGVDEHPISKKQLQDAFRELASASIKRLRTHKVLPQFRRTSPFAILRQYRGVIQQAIQDELKGLATGPTIGNLERAASSLLIRDVHWDNSTGVVIAGFGRKQFFPSMRCYEFSSVVAGRLRVRENTERRADVTFENTAIIHAFAQSEMVSQFMDGIDQDYREFIRQFAVFTLLTTYPKLISKLLVGRVSPSQIRQIQKKFARGGTHVIAALLDEMQKYSSRWHSSPIIRIVHSLPKEELAAMAEALVNLTSFKRHITHDAETVGGPIDVAVVSRGDGFVWIKRKHYFSKDLNPHFLANYYRKGN